jgi:broad specificity phosphatase PhoE
LDELSKCSAQDSRRIGLANKMTDYAPPTRLRFLSHPATPQLRNGTFPTDEPLDPRAFATLESLAWNPQGIQKLWVSPELRTVQTAAALGLHAELAPELRECDYGSWQGHALEDLFDTDPAGLTSWLEDLSAAPHHGESLRDLVTRVADWLESQRRAGPSIVVTHASIIRAVIVHTLSAPLESFGQIEVAPLTLTDIRLSGGRWHLRSVAVPLASQPAIGDD